MIKLSEKTLKIINDIIDVGQLFNIGVFILDKNGIRAKAEESYIFLMKHQPLDFLEFDSLCISRVSDFKTRMKFMESSSGKSGFDIFAAETKTLDSGDNIVLKLRLISDRTSVEITGDNGAKNQLPKQVNDEDMVSFTLSHDSIEVLSKLPRAIQNKNKALNIKMVNGIVVASSRDVHRDYVQHIISESPEFMGDSEPFDFTYNLTNIVPMIRGRMSLDVTLTKRGVMRTTLNDIDVAIFPEKIAD
jgi:hypothetical protein